MAATVSIRMASALAISAGIAVAMSARSLGTRCVFEIQRGCRTGQRLRGSE
jgi:hypothetical protein